MYNKKECPKIGWWIFKFTFHDWDDWVQFASIEARICKKCGLIEDRKIWEE